MTDTAHDISADRHAIESKTQEWEDAFNRGDAAAIAAMMSTDAQLLPPNGDPVDGREAIHAFWQAFIDTGVKGALEHVEIEVHGDMAYKLGRFKILSAEGDELDHGKFFELWRRIDGTWQFHRDMWNSSTPLPEEG